jgi:hypothetical protein
MAAVGVSELHKIEGAVTGWRRVLRAQE